MITKSRKISASRRSLLFGRLRSASIELRSVAYLIQMQRFDEGPPLDLEEIHDGLGLILERIAKKVRRISNDLEESQSI